MCDLCNAQYQGEKDRPDCPSNPTSQQEMIEQRAEFHVMKRNNPQTIVTSEQEAKEDIDWFFAHLPAPASREELREKIAMIIAHGAGVKLSPLDMSYTVWSNYLKQADSILSLLQPDDQKEATRQEINKMLEPSGFSIGTISDSTGILEFTICDRDGDEIDLGSMTHIMDDYMTPNDDSLQPVEVVLPRNPYKYQHVREDEKFCFIGYVRALDDLKKQNPNVKFK
jgi:hypothetical protein